MQALLVYAEDRISWSTTIEAAEEHLGDDAAEWLRRRRRDDQFRSKSLLLAHLPDVDGQHAYVFYTWSGVGDNEQGRLYAIMSELLEHEEARELLGVTAVHST